MEYQLVPYTIQFGVKGTEEFRPLDDLDGDRLTAQEVVTDTFHTMVGRTRTAKPSDDDVVIDAPIITTEHVWSGPAGLLAQVAYGTRGMQGSVTQADGNEFSIVPDDVTNVPLRHGMLFPRSGKVGLLLAERFGGRGVMTPLSQMLKSLVAERVPGLRVDVRPAMSEEAMNRWAAGSRIKALVLHRVSTRDGVSSGEVGVPSFRLAKPRRRFFSWDQFKNEEGRVDDVQVMRHLLPELPRGTTSQDAEQAAQELVDEGWRVALELRNGGKTRQYHVDTQQGITLSFPAGNGPRGPADNSGFSKACGEAVDELGSTGVVSGLESKHCTWPDKLTQQPRWKGDWGVDPRSASTADDASGPVPPSPS